MKTGFTLSGGGALGSFQVGALRYLYDRGIFPSVIVGTSVGAINGLKLAEGNPGPNLPGDRGIFGLERLWLEVMEETADMIVAEDAFKPFDDKNRDETLERALISIGAPTLGAAVSAGGSLVGFAAGLPAVGAALAITSYFLGDEAKGNAEDELEKVKRLLRSKSLYHLGPIEEKMRKRENLDFDMFNNSTVDLYVAAVGLTSGVLRYFRKNGEVFETSMLRRVDGWFIKDFIAAVLASAAIPTFFRARALPKTIPGHEVEFEDHMDGGAREILPLRATLTAGASEVYAIVCDPRNITKRPEEIDGIISMAEQSLSLLEEEALANDIEASEQTGASIIMINPTIPVHSSRKIIPGLIKINRDYGYMRAFDNESRRLGPRARQHARFLSDEITRRRLRIFVEEEKFWTEGFDLDTVRALKTQLRGVIDRRKLVFGERSAPPESDDWVNNYEKHYHPDETEQIDAIRLWENQFPPFPTNTLSDPLDIRFARHKGASSPSGPYIQSDWGVHGNFEVLFAQQGRIFHYWRDNDANGFPWHRGAELPLMVTKPGGGKPQTGIQGEPVSVSFFQSSLGPDRNHGNFEAVAHFKSVFGDDDFLATYFFDANDRQWHGPIQISVDVGGGRNELISGVAGQPAMIQSDFGRNGNFELLAPQGGRIVHYFRDNDAPGFPWRRVGELPQLGEVAGIPKQTAINAEPVSVNFFQSDFMAGPGQRNGNLEAVVHFRNVLDGRDFLATYFFSADDRQWRGPIPIEVNVGGNRKQLIEGVTGRPVMIQSEYGPDRGNFELLVPQGDRIVHYWRNNSAPGLPWAISGELPIPSVAPGGGGLPKASLKLEPVSASFFQSNFRSRNGLGNFEAIVLFQSVFGGDQLVATYWFAAREGKWNGPAQVVTIEPPSEINGVSPF